ncbi:hypothetical protein DFH07DRAFT_590324 [Mycena maculata]|uniref:Uncharacterized protein n=1 Tax=Mycena maculata TaxID=230809 RepID=A0AAD7N6I1_9AGAR|nr:hypothetical protein DFH07DRAFT_590324 [Mycena maculata]
MDSFSHWSRIPPELAHEIAGHNADDIPTLRALSLASKSTRSSAIIYLFSFIHFACPEDFSQWLDMLDRTPALATIVKRVKLSEPGKDWLRRRRLQRRFQSATELRNSIVPPIIPALPSVHSVEWDYTHAVRGNLVMMVAHMALFPNVKKLYLNNMGFNRFAELMYLLGACGRLQWLSLETTTVELDEEDNYNYPEIQSDGDAARESGTLALTVDRERFIPSPRTPFDLTALEGLVITDCHYPDGNDYFIGLLEDSRPNGLKSLAFGGFCHDEPCSIHATEKLLRLSAPSLVKLVIDPTFQYTDNRQVLDMFSRLPAFNTLESLTVWLNPKRQVEHFINELKGAPNLTALAFRIVLYEGSDEDDREEFDKILREALHWPGAESMKTVLLRKFPLCQRIGFHFCIPGDSDMHFRRGLRRRMERRLKERLGQAGADIAEYLEVEWLDEELNPVTYNRTNRKPPWIVARSRHFQEPETEASDCESEKSDADSEEWDSDGNIVIREWTAEHERAYRREMLAECGIYSDDDRGLEDYDYDFRYLHYKGR